MRADVLLCDPVELEHRDAGLEVLGAERERLGEECAGLRHAFDLLGGLADDHARASTEESASLISWKTSSIVRSPWMPTTLPRVRYHSTSGAVSRS